MDAYSEGIFLIKNALIVDPSSSYNGKRADILVEDGKITNIDTNIREQFGSTVIDHKDLHVSPGWVDMHVNVQDPGFEYKEDIETALAAAAAGGYTAILSCSTTEPPVDNKSTVEYQLQRAKGNLVDLHVSGTISKGAKGDELAEMYDMHRAGARAFYDFKSTVINTQLLKLALLYTKPFGGLIMNYPKEKYLSEGGVANEGLVSTETGLQGIPDIAEEIGLQRALKLAEYTEQKIHFTSISTRTGIDIIKKAKKSGQAVTTGVSIANLYFNETAVSSFDANYKLDPPLRDEKTRTALVNALAAGTIDIVISDHWPQNVERKECEYERAAFGMISLETTYAMLNSVVGDKLNQEEMVKLMALRPRDILNLPCPIIDKGRPANLTLFQPKQKWKYNLSQSPSLSRNSPLDGQTFTGKVIGSINNGQCHLNA